MNLAAGGLYAILDAGAVPAAHRAAAAEAALAGGAGMLQYRDKSGDPAAARASAEALLAVCRNTGAPLIINDDIDTADIIGADGVHLGRTDTAVAAARERLGPSAIIGATCHASVDAAALAVRDGASYVSFGRFFPSRTKPGAPPADRTVLEQARQRLSLPIVAIGGVDTDNGASLIAAGADWLAVSNAIFGAGDVRAAAARLAALFTD